MKFKGKIAATLIAVSMVSSSMAAFACDKDTLVGFAERPDWLGRYSITKYCPYTNQSVETFASQVDWKHEFYEAAYPHKELASLWLDGQNMQYIAETGAVANVPTRVQKDFWESKAPYNVYGRIWSALDGVNFKPAGDEYVKSMQLTEDVDVNYDYFGFDKYRVFPNGEVQDYSLFYRDYAEKIDGKNPSRYIYDYLAELEYRYDEMTIRKNADGSRMTDANGDYVYTDAFYEGTAWAAYGLFDNVTRYNSEYLTGPDYANGGTVTVDVATKLMDTGASNAFDSVVVAEQFDTRLEWKLATYEIKEPYRYYEYLYIDGVCMDGSWVKLAGAVDEEGADVYTQLPIIWRYTGGFAKPEVTWETAFAEANYPHKIYEEKFVDGRATGVYRSTGRFADGKPYVYKDGYSDRYLVINLSDPSIKAADVKSILSNYHYEYYEAGDTIIVTQSAQYLHEGHADWKEQVEYILRGVVSSDWINGVYELR